MNQSQESTTTTSRTITADGCVVWKMRSTAAGGKFGFLHTRDFDPMLLQEVI